ncbi:hypothetical protein E6C76_07340 [Pseudothauera nasutitermitis]|uniref:Uncharacterized protein n=1 Tax=Pseudothauera nasutitermitis TaxID=2565930 RepID=A0A4S4B2B3_9RHOO|nr:hypothetical protein [Pseudothauera nasutitermitis]THF66629.1 hypothetical protein E6C76_07340 [Pseudothauera nasutitermitis]
MTLVILAPWVTYIYWFAIHPPGGSSLSTDTEIWGQFGDFIGGVLNPVVATGAFCLLAISVGIQKRELEATRDVMTKQSETLKQQAFESTFFSLLDQLKDSNHRLSELAERWPPSSEEFAGEPPPSSLANLQPEPVSQFIAVRQHLQMSRSRLNLMPVAVAQKNCDLHFPAVIKNGMNLLQILQFLDLRSPELDKDRLSFYLRLIRNQTDGPTLLLIAARALPGAPDYPTPEHRLGLKALLEKFAMLEEIGFKGNAAPFGYEGQVMAFYDSSAFGNNEGYRQFQEAQVRNSNSL